ncbi:MAG: glycosyl transferase [Patescibacteria group bacterium]|nr:MAG: glycosyl transferase [Patescibacteria group bacterium]
MVDYKVSVVITNYNGRDLLAKNLPSVVKASKNPKNRIIEIIVVDDASTDGSVNFLKKEFADVRVIFHRKNRGFASASNTGIRSAKGNLICLLNNDVSCTENFLESAIKIFQSNEKVFGVSLHETGYGPAAGCFENGFVVHKPLPQTDRPQKTFWVSGGSGVFRRDLWIKVGWFDEETFAPFYWEDVDISYRALKMGHELWWDPEGLVFHNHEQTIGKFNKKYKSRVQERNQLLFIWKNITSKRLFARHIAGLFSRVFSHPGYIIVIFLALLKLKYVMKFRSRNKKEELVADEFIFASFKQ